MASSCQAARSWRAGAFILELHRGSSGLRGGAAHLLQQSGGAVYTVTSRDAELMLTLALVFANITPSVCSPSLKHEQYEHVRGNV